MAYKRVKEFDKHTHFYLCETSSYHIIYQFRFANCDVSVGKVDGMQGYEEGLWELAIGRILNDKGKFEIVDEQIYGYLNDDQVLQKLEKIECAEN